jgi:hypothetical protein
MLCADPGLAYSIPILKSCLGVVTKARKYEDTKAQMLFYFVLSIFRVFVIKFFYLQTCFVPACPD